MLERMGNFAINIHGVGGHSIDPAHDNTAESLTADFVALLRGKGHSIISAKVTSGAEVDVDQAAFADAAQRRADKR